MKQGRSEVYLPEEYEKLYTARRRRRKSRICMFIAVAAGLLLTGSVLRVRQVNAKVQETQQELAGEVFRFHVLANSDSEKDQALKMKVKEEVLSFMKRELPDAKSAEETKAWAKENLGKIEELTETVVRNEGFGYTAHAEVAMCDFPDKTYGDVTFPAGRYEALRIEIGAGGGHNWWCVLYPNLCFLDAVHAVVPDEGKEELKDVLTDEEYDLVTMGTDFKIRWFFLGD